MMESTEYTYVTEDGIMYVHTQFGIFQLVAGDELTPEEFEKIKDKELVYHSDSMREYAGLVATKDEKRKIAELLMPDYGFTLDEIIDELESRDIIVKRDYVSDGPGWCGDLFIIIWGEPQFTSYIGCGINGEWEVFFNGEIE